MFAMGVSLTGSDWPKLLLIILTGLLYFGVFLTMSIFVSALTHRSSNSFLILLIIWVLCIHVIPRASVLLAARSVKVPSVDEQAYQKSTLGLQLADEFFDGMSNFEGGTSDLPPDQFATVFNEYIDSLSDIRTSKMDELTKRLNEDRRNRQMMQEKLAFAIARISPATSLTLASANLAGTSLALKNNLTGEAVNYQNQFGQFIKDKTGMNPGGFLRVKVSVQYDGEGEPEKPEPIDPNEIPKFDFKKPTLAQAVNSSLTDMGILAFFNLLFFAGTFVAFVKYDLR